jgi:hypothetical protein
VPIRSAASTTPPPRARSIAEVHVYLDLLGWPPGRRGQGLVRHGDALLSEYRWDHAPPGVPGVIRIHVPDDALATTGFGGPGPSTLIDPEGWRLAADRLADAVPASPADAPPERHRALRARLDRAIACLDQIGLFADAHGRLGPGAFFTARGRATFRREPGRFDPERLDVTAARWREIAARYDEGAP